MKQAGGIYGPNGAISHYELSAEDGEDAYIVFGSDERPDHYPMYVHDLLRHLHLPYYVKKPESGWRKPEEMSAKEKAKLRPIAETLAMLDGNAFFGNDVEDREWYEGYLGEAHALYESNGGDSGWAGLASFAKTPE